MKIIPAAFELQLIAIIRTARDYLQVDNNQLRLISVTRCNEQLGWKVCIEENFNNELKRSTVVVSPFRNTWIVTDCFTGN